MAVADYFDRAALAAAHALAGGFEGTRFRQLLEETPVGLAIDASANMPEGSAIAEMTVRLLARLYPTLSISATDDATRERARLSEIAREINPQIEISEESAAFGIAIGSAPSTFSEAIYLGSNGWDAYVSTAGEQTVGESPIVFGGAAAACIGCANLFRRIFTEDWPASADRRLVFSTFDLARNPTPQQPDLPSADEEPVVLVGVGAIGNATAWALSRTPFRGTLHLVDEQTIELSNLQRYILATRADEGAVKVDVAASFFEGGDERMTAIPHQKPWAAFTTEEGYAWPRVLLALDTAADRRSAQAGLPCWIANAWTQPGDLGVSIHPNFASDGACVSCLYLQDKALPSEDQLIADALQVPEMVNQVRQFLHTGEGLQLPFLNLVAERLGRPQEAVVPFVGRPIRDLYVVGICGGAVLPLGAAGVPDASLHVPLAHQSALAGVLLAASYVRSLTEAALADTRVVRIDLLKALGEIEPLAMLKRGDGRCICEDADYVTAYESKWSLTSRSNSA
jgi:hypothetical protein